MQLKVTKADSSIEEYSHTKLIATLSNALGSVSQEDVFVAEQLAEALTFFLYHNYSSHCMITSNEILSMAKAVLVSTGYDKAAMMLSEHHHMRNLCRSRIDVVKMDVRNLSDAAELAALRRNGLAQQWNKSKIIAGLVAEQGLDYSMARVVASMVEDRIINSRLRCVSCSLIKQLVLSDTLTVLEGTEQLQAASQQDAKKQDNTGTDAPLWQLQKGFCPIGV